jgi:hypothetical protein
VEFIFGEVEDFVQIESGPVRVKNEFFVGARRGFLMMGAGENAIATAEEMISDFGG